MKKEPREYISPLLHPPLNRLFISRPRLEPFKSTDGIRSDFSNPDKPKPTSISQSDLDRLNSYQLSQAAPSRVELLREQATNKKSQKALQHQKKLTHLIRRYKIPKLSTDPFNTVFLGRLPRNISDRQLRRELSPFGNIAHIELLANRCIAFVVFEREKDARRFVRDYEEIRIEGRKVVVDVERARTVEGWLPRQLGGGLGGRNAHGRDPKAKIVPPPSTLSSSSSGSSSNSNIQSLNSSGVSAPPPLKQSHPEPSFHRIQVEYGDI
jgi:U1 small nuclear ribonucleoprotein 70kDa